MNYHFFLEKDDQAKFSLLCLLTESDHHHLLLKSAQQQLQLTHYKLTQLINELETDLQLCHINSSELINKDGFLIGRHISYSTCQELQLGYLQRSLTFQIFEREYLDDESVSRQQFISQHFISQAKYYQVRAKIGDFFEENSLRYSNDNQSPSELLIRARLTDIYYYFYGGIAEPFPELKTMTTNFQTLLTMTLGISMTPSVQIKIRIFFQIQLMRLRSHHFLKIADLFQVNHQDNVPELIKFYRKQVLNTSDECLDSEVTYLYLFLISQQLVPNDAVVFSGTCRSVFGVFRQQVKKLLATSPLLNHESFDTINVDTVIDHLFLIDQASPLFELHTFPTTPIHNFSLEFPEFTNLATKIAATAEELCRTHLTTISRQKVIQNFTQTLVNLIPLEAIRTTVRIYVDFSHSSVPFETTQQMMNFYLGGGILLMDHLASDTDIFVSDTCIKGVQTDYQITIANPYQMADWTRLRQTVLELKRVKLAKLQAEY